MSEIPEHLLKRSKQAKSGKTGQPADSANETAAPAASTEVAAAATPAAPQADLPYLDPEPEPSKPEPEFINAYKSRKKIPFWAMPVVLATPVWAFGLVGTLQQPETEDPLLVESAEIYVAAGCAGCHGANGGGGTGYQLSDGEVLKTFPEPIDMMVHVARGSSEINGDEYGAARENGSRRVSGSLGQMPAQAAALSMEELELVIYHERATLSGEDMSSEANAEWAEHIREAAESGAETEIDLEFLLACANPEFTPGATGEGSPDPEGMPCPGPHGEEESE